MDGVGATANNTMHLPFLACIHPTACWDVLTSSRELAFSSAAGGLFRFFLFCNCFLVGVERVGACPKWWPWTAVVMAMRSTTTTTTMKVIWPDDLLRNNENASVGPTFPFRMIGDLPTHMDFPLLPFGFCIWLFFPFSIFVHFLVEIFLHAVMTRD